MVDSALAGKEKEPAKQRVKEAPYVNQIHKQAGDDATETDDEIEERKDRSKKGSRGSAMSVTPSKKQRSGKVRFSNLKAEDDGRKSRHQSIDQSALYQTFKGVMLHAGLDESKFSNDDVGSRRFLSQGA